VIRNYDDFVSTLLDAGFSMGGGNSEGIYTIINWNWNEEPPYETPIQWHTGNKETDPWEWRIRVLEERNDIAYSKIFFKKSGFITKKWYPYFLAARRDGQDFEQTYKDGTISHFAKRIYEVIVANGRIPLQDIKLKGEFSREDKAGFDRALNELQMKMFVTICGTQVRISKNGSANNVMPSTMLCTTEEFWGAELFKTADSIPCKSAIEEIMQQVLRINPSANERKISKFILGA